MASSNALLKFSRQIHRYLGLFIAPALIFFAFTGALQTFSLHETTQGSDYKPPAWIATLAQIHKKQTDVVPVRKPKPGPDKIPTDKAAKSDKPADPNAPPAPKPKTHLPMKVFFLVVAVGLLISSVTGIYMAYRYGGSKLVTTSLLLAGVVVPVVLLKF
jgi:hypothetical protein